MSKSDPMNEGVLDYLKGLWNSVTGNSNSAVIGKIDNAQEEDDGYAGVEDIVIQDPIIRKKVAHLFIRGLRLYREAELFHVADRELEAILTGVWSGKIPLSKFVGIARDGTLERIYSRVRERIRYQKRKKGVWYESKEDY